MDNSELIPVQQAPAIRGLSNLLRSELKSWWKTRKWISYSIMWIFIINIMVFLLFSIDVPGQSDSDVIRQGVIFYAIFAFISSSIGVIISSQDTIIGEKQSGTAAWVLSKPISRRSFILAKFISDFLGIITTMIIFPGIVVYLQIGLLHGTWLSIPGFVTGLVLLIINAVFFLSLTMFMGTVFDSRAPLLGISLGFLFGMQYLTSIDERLIEYIPYPIGNPVLSDPLIVQAIYQESLWTIIPLVVCSLFAVIFMIAAVMRFDREEF